MSQFDPFNDSEISNLAANESVPDEPVDTVTVKGFKADTDGEQLHSFIDSGPVIITEQEVSDRAERELQSDDASSEREQPTEPRVALLKSPDELSNLMTSYFEGILQKQSSSKEKLLSKFDVSTLQAENGYSITDGRNETYLYQVAINESRLISLFTATFGEAGMVQFEILGPSYTKIAPANNPFAGLYSALLVSMGLGDVYQLHNRYVILATSHPYPVPLDAGTVEFTFLDKLEIRLLD